MSYLFSSFSWVRKQKSKTKNKNEKLHIATLLTFKARCISQEGDINKLGGYSPLILSTAVTYLVILQKIIC